MNNKGVKLFNAILMIAAGLMLLVYIYDLSEIQVTGKCDNCIFIPEVVELKNDIFS